MTAPENAGDAEAVKADMRAKLIDILDAEDIEVTDSQADLIVDYFAAREAAPLGDEGEAVADFAAWIEGLPREPNQALRDLFTTYKKAIAEGRLITDAYPQNTAKLIAEAVALRERVAELEGVLDLANERLQGSNDRANFLAEIIRDCPDARNVWGQRIADEAARTAGGSADE